MSNTSNRLEARKLPKRSRKKSPQPQSPQIDLSAPEYYLNREVSWIEFNHRVLHEAMDPRTPLLERLRFTAIFSSNLDEYFMVRVAALKEQIEAGMVKRSPDGLSTQQQVEVIGDRLRPIVREQHRHVEQTLRPLLKDHGIHLLNYADLNAEQLHYIERYFEEQIFPVLTPLAVDSGHPVPYLANLSLSVAATVQNTETGESRQARVKVPPVLSRFIQLPTALWPASLGTPTVWAGIPVEQVIAHNLDALFPNMQVKSPYLFRITRNADFDVAGDEDEDLVQAIEQELRKRRLGGSAVRLEVHESMPEGDRQSLMDELGLTENDLYEVEGLLCHTDLMSFVDLALPALKAPRWSPVIPQRLQRLPKTPRSRPGFRAESPRYAEEDDIFAILRNHDLMVHHPYHSFTATVHRFIVDAARDPDVLAIKMTLYRTSGDSPVIDTLIEAAQNGKQVTVLVELKARFDEENNINWARQLEKAGVHVVYGLVGLKTHAKLTLVVRREEQGIRRYVHLGTGDYNPRTARLYADVGLFSSREALGTDLTDLFNYLTGYSRQNTYRRLFVAPVNLRDRLLQLIYREIDHQKQGKHGRIVAKMNALVDPKLITALYEASQAGVEIDLIVRGICCLRPGVSGVSETIRVISIVGRFLEHSRLFYFNNDGHEAVYISSADLMPRNLDRRVEVMVPVEDEAIAKDLQEILGVMLADNRQAWELQSDGQYLQRHPQAGNLEHCAQTQLMDMALHG
jgi:polyphosphate kinase